MVIICIITTLQGKSSAAYSNCGKWTRRQPTWPSRFKDRSQRRGYQQSAEQGGQQVGHSSLPHNDLIGDLLGVNDASISMSLVELTQNQRRKKERRKRAGYPLKVKSCIVPVNKCSFVQMQTASFIHLYIYSCCIFINAVLNKAAFE
jgi:hypothetical protein